MERIVKKYLEKFNKEHKRNRRLGGVFLVLALLVTVGISWQLRFTGIALTNATYCGLEEHTHTDECYEEVLICELEESDGEEGHTHTDECYTEVSTLVCTLEESEGHVHTADCYQTVETYVCGLNEGDGAHTHNATCYDEEGNLICGLEESAGHVHTADCIQTSEVLICGMTEGEGAHTHTDACYETTRELTCGLEEGEAVAAHTHTEECYEKVLVCELEEHSHTAECLIDETADVETASDWEATLPTSLNGTWAENLVAVAKSQLGYSESTANYQLDDDGTTHKGYTRYGAWYGNAYGDWCAMFASFCLHYAGVPEEAVPAASGVYAWTVSLDKMELYRTEDTYTPSVGDLIFFDTDNDGKADHVGIVEKFTTHTDSSTGEEVIQTIYTIEGNSSNSVKENKYSPSDSTIIGYADLDAAHIAYTGESMYAEAEEESEDESETENESESETETEVESESETDTESETETETENETETTAYELKSQGEDYTVVVSFGEDVELPEDVVLVVEEYYEDSETYQARYAEAASLYGWDETKESGDEIAEESVKEAATEAKDIEDAAEAEDVVSESENESDEETIEESAVTVSEFRLFSIGLYVDGKEVELSDQGKVVITYQGKEADTLYTVTEFGKNGEEGTTIESTSEYSVESGEQTIKFAMNASTDYAISSVVEAKIEETAKEEEPKTLTYEGEDYIVTVTYGSDAELPDDVELLVSEYAQDSEIYLARYAEAAALYGWNSGNSETKENADDSDSEITGTEDEATSTSEEEGASSETVEVSESTSSYHGFRLFNIGLYVDEEEIEPAAAVTVTISYLGKDAWESYSVTHFAEEDTKNVDATSNYEEGNQTITFDADGFSDWGISVTAENGAYLTIEVGETGTIIGTTSNRNHTWSSSNDEIATVKNSTNTASVTGVAVGTVTITHEYGNEKETFTVEVVASGSIVLNLGNGNGTLQDSDYSGGSQGSGGTDLRYTINVAAAADEDGNVTINLPSDRDLDSTFTVATDSDGNNITQDLGNEAAPYKWKLVGWINIATGEYYDVSGGSVTATIDLAESNVFYADWIAESYNYGSSSSLGEDTSDFVQIEMFDYNELFNLYSATLTQSGLTSESWADSGSLYSGVLESGSILDSSFIFHNSRTNNNSDSNNYSNGLLGYVTGLKSWNSNNEQPYTVWSMSSAAGSPVLNKLFDTSGSTIGVTYVGSANYLFQVDDEGYYYFDSDKNGAAYNQSAQRFYLSDTTTTVNGSDGNYGTAFFPYNEVASYTSISNGTLNYWFGMSVEMDFYLPNDVGTNGNQYNDEDMVFEFSGDDDVWVFVDDELVLNISGVHSEMEGSINFSTGEVNVKTADSVTWANYSSSSKLNNCSAGTHTLKVYYLERGAWDSNLSIKFNVVPRWQYETASAGTMSVTKTWSDSESSHSSVIMGLFEKTSTLASAGSEVTYDDTGYTLDSNGYSYDANTDYINAYASGGYLYVLVDTQEVNDKNNWTYTWELLNIDKTYEVLELTELSNYKTSSSYSALQSYDYWSAVGYEELNGTVELSGTDYIRTGGILKDGLEILLTDGAQNGKESTNSFPTTYTGYVIDSGDGVSTVSSQFSQAATPNSSGTYTYGVTSDTYISDTSVWTVELTGSYASFTESGQAYYAPTFYLQDSSGNYLAITGSSGNYSLTIVSGSENATAFSYNSLGELNTEGSTGLKVTITSGSYALVTGRQNETDTENVKIYVKQEVTTTGKSYTITNTLLPTITLKKVDSTDDTKNLSGAVFTLQNSDGEYYSYTGDAVNWSDQEKYLTTDNNGVISFTALPDGTYTLTENTAPDGYNLLSSTITIVVENGVVVSGTYGESKSSIVSIDNETGLIITVQNTPGVELPSTGGFGIWMYTMAGMLILLGAAYLMYKKSGRKGDMSY